MQLIKKNMYIRHVCSKIPFSLSHVHVCIFAQSAHGFYCSPCQRLNFYWHSLYWSKRYYVELQLHLISHEHNGKVPQDGTEMCSGHIRKCHIQLWHPLDTEIHVLLIIPHWRCGLFTWISIDVKSPNELHVHVHVSLFLYILWGTPGFSYIF